MLQGVTSFSDSAGTTTPVNDVFMLYNGFGQLSAEFESHSSSWGALSRTCTYNTANQITEN